MKKMNLQKGSLTDIVIFLIIVLFLLLVFGVNLFDWIANGVDWLANFIRGL